MGYTTNLRILMMVGFGGIVHKKGRLLVCELFWLMVINGDYRMVIIEWWLLVIIEWLMVIIGFWRTYQQGNVIL